MEPLNYPQNPSTKGGPGERRTSEMVKGFANIILWLSLLHLPLCHLVLGVFRNWESSLSPVLMFHALFHPVRWFRSEDFLSSLIDPLTLYPRIVGRFLQDSRLLILSQHVDNPSEK